MIKVFQWWSRSCEAEYGPTSELDYRSVRVEKLKGRKSTFQFRLRCDAELLMVVTPFRGNTEKVSIAFAISSTLF